MQWYEKYIGETYSEENDCMALAIRVGAEFGYLIQKPSYNANVYAQARALQLYKDDLAVKTDKKQDGNPVLFLCRKRFFHIGVYVRIDSEDWILHADQRSGFVILTRLREMAQYGYELEGFYQWKQM
ncbi:hypothetical protein [Pelistega ratti]|uniref:hypothetical protein n=1 Tax=Pelistega ratti TaxID=2652177 RepID=UPI0013590912|nr:hypothetical protein [Pelistega ratti]